MNPKTIGIVFVIQPLIAFLSFCESSFPTMIRQRYRSSGGAFPLRICPSGFLWFTIKTVLHHHPGIVKFDINFPKSRDKMQSQIWDPGASYVGSEKGAIKSQLVFMSNNRLLFSTVKILILILLMVPIRSVKKLTLTDGVDGDHFPWSAISSLPERGQCSSQTQENLIYSFGRLYKPRHAHGGSCDWFILLVQANVVSLIIKYINIIYYNETYRLSLMYHGFTMLKILPNILWWHWIDLLWQHQCVRRQWGLAKEHRKSLPESSSISISRRRQDLESSPTTLNQHFLIKVMPKPFWSFSSKLIANKKCVKEGLNRLHLLPISLPKASRVTSTPSSKLFQFPIFAYNGCIGMFLYFVNTF